MAEKSGLPALPCPECRARGGTGGQRIGNRSRKCKTCNRFARAVESRVSAALRAAHPGDTRRFRLRAEAELYPAHIGKFDEENQAAREVIFRKERDGSE